MGPSVLSRRSPRQWLDLALTVALGIIVVVLVLMTFRPSPSELVIEAGDSAAAVALVGSDGEVRTFRFDGSESTNDVATPLFVLSTDCGICKQTIPAWREASERLQAQGVQPRYVVVDEGADLSAIAELVGADIVYRPQDIRTFAADYKLVGVPLTLVVNPDGEVTFSKLGFLSPDDVDAVTSTACGTKFGCVAG